MLDSMETLSMLKYIGGSLFVFAILLGILVYVKKSNGTFFSKHKHSQRLSVTNVLSLDPKNRLVLIKRDGVEHLILIGATQNMLIEQNIDKANETASQFKKAMNDDQTLKAQKL